jgi:type IV pilus assembly protein PilC
MKTFSVTAADANGVRRVFMRSGTSRDEVVSALRYENWLVLGLKECADASTYLPPLWHPSWLRPIRMIDIETGLRALSSMLKSGVTLLQGLRTMAEQSPSPRAKKMWMSVAERVLGGTSFAEALSSRPRQFSDVVVRLCEVGERSGELYISVARAADQLEARRNLRSAVINALMYPAFVVLAAIGVSVYLVLAVIPKIADFLEAGGAQLPQVTQMLVDFSQWLSTNGLFIPVWIAAFVAVWWAIRLYPKGRDLEDAFLLRIPVTGGILRLSGTSLFARSMQIMTESGVALLDALSTAASLMSNFRFRRRILEAHAGVLNGSPLAVSLVGASEFPPILRHMAAVGEESGALPETFAETARLHEMMLAVAVKRFGMLIEPVVIVITGLIVGFVYIAFFTAIFAIAGAS